MPRSGWPHDGRALLMAKRRRLGRPVDKKGRSKEVEQYAPLPYALLHSDAWRGLSGAAVKVFIELRTRFHGVNNGHLILSLEEASRLLQLGKATVMRALEELQERGFVICTRKGQWYGRLASTWAVTDRGINGAPATNDWKAWRPSARCAVNGHQKTERGSGMKPSATTTVPFQNREHAHGSISAPVSPIRLVAMGSGMDR